MADRQSDKNKNQPVELHPDGTPVEPGGPPGGAPVDEAKLTRRERRARRKQEAQDESIQEEEAFFREVQEEVRAERTFNILKKYGSWILLVGVLLIAGVAGYQYWQSREEAAQVESSRQFSQAIQQLQQGKHKEAAETFGLVAREGTEGFAALAQLRRGAALAQAGDIKGAVSAYRALAGKADAPATLRQVATLMWALHAVDTAPPAEMIERLRPFTADANPWRHLAREVTGYYQEKAKQVDAARKTFAALAADKTAPDAIRARARDMLALIGRP